MLKEGLLSTQLGACQGNRGAKSFLSRVTEARPNLKPLCLLDLDGAECFLLPSGNYEDYFTGLPDGAEVMSSRWGGKQAFALFPMDKNGLLTYPQGRCCKLLAANNRTIFPEPSGSSKDGQKASETSRKSGNKLLGFLSRHVTVKTTVNGQSASTNRPPDPWPWQFNALPVNLDFSRLREDFYTFGHAGRIRVNTLFTGRFEVKFQIESAAFDAARTTQMALVPSLYDQQNQTAIWDLSTGSVQASVADMTSRIQRESRIQSP